MASKYQSIALELPSEFVEASAGFSLDIGCSTAKLIYRSNEDYHNGKPKKDELKTGTGRVYIITCIPRTELDDVMEIVRKKCDLIRPEGKKPEVFTTGAGSNFFKDRLEKGLDVHMINIVEMDCFFHAFHQLNQTKDAQDLFYPPHEKGVEEGKTEAAVFEEVLAKFQGKQISRESVGPISTEDNEIFPCIIAMCGSGIGFMQIEEDGTTSKILDETPLGGRAFLGLSVLLTGEKDFSSILTSIGKGTGRSANEYMSDLISDEGREDNYSETREGMNKLERPAMYFGKAITQERDSIKSDDILSSLYSVLCQHMVQLGLHNCRGSGIYRLFVCGNLFDNEHARYTITREFYMKQTMIKMDKVPKLRFIKHGGHLGSLGAFMKANEKKEVAAQVKTN